MAPAPAADPLVIRSLEFIGGMGEMEGWRPDSSLPEVAFAGRSNVGKSSLLNTLVRRKSFARVSKTPGRTREINFFRVNGTFVLVDLPGYGYAKISKDRKAEWKPMIESYLRRTTQLRGLVLLLDVRRKPTDDDRAMLDFLAELEVPTLIALTKMDKLSRAAGAAQLKQVTLGLALDPEQVIPFSSMTGAGRDDLAAALLTLVELPGVGTVEPE
ncbi:MAG: ribosome biogenesis GTP-binding protein YihA/YsxC [Gemmatimonadota bacterium]|nr:ribosome biogenesis GTP-binding protein YihA/YsxC [Gemmatimonadota bacterium]